VIAARQAKSSRRPSRLFRCHADTTPTVDSSQLDPNDERVIVPRALEAGDQIRLIAPAGWFEREPFDAGRRWLEQRYQVVCRDDLFDRDGFFAGSDQRRAEELIEALADPDTRAIVCARGGHGSLRLLESFNTLDGERLWRRDPKWLVGFSDITVLHSLSWRQSVCSIHGANVTSLGRALHADDRELLEQWTSRLERPLESSTWELSAAADSPQTGTVEGILLGGNLTLLSSLASARRLELPTSSVLLLEDVGEAPYRLDRALVSLRLGGHLERVSAIVLGKFVDCPEGHHAVTALDAVVDALRPLGVPVVHGLPVGHGAQNRALMLGSTASLSVSGARAELRLEAPKQVSTRRR